MAVGDVRLSRRSAFSLVEILVVLAMIAVLLVALVPALKSFGGSSARKSTANILLSLIEQSRVQAIRDGRATYVVFPAAWSGSSGITDQAVLDRYFYKSAAIFEDAPDGSGTKVQVGGWKTFPSGVSLRSEIAFPAGNATSNAVWSADSFDFTPGLATGQQFPYMKFDQTGALVSPTAYAAGSPIHLRFFEGFVTGTYETATTSTNKDEVIDIAPLTGRATYL